MHRAVLVFAALAGCGRFVDEDGDLWPPPDTGTTVERRDPQDFDPCPRLEIDDPLPLSGASPETGTSDPRVAWNQETEQFIVVWREGTRIAFQRLDGDGRPVGLERTALERTLPGLDDTPVVADGDPAVLAVPGLVGSPTFLTIQRGSELFIDRLLAGRDVVERQNHPLLDAVETDGRAGEARIPSMVSDGSRLAVAYQSQSGAQLTLLRLQDFGPACEHETDEDPPACSDGAYGAYWPAAVGWLPAPEDDTDVAANETAGVVEPAWWMAERTAVSRELTWIVLRPGAPAGTFEEQLPAVRVGAEGVEQGPRIATGDRRLALAMRRTGGQTEAWQVTGDGASACVLGAPELSAGVPAITWAHGRRLAVVGLWPRESGDVDVVVARGDAPATEADRALAQDRACPAPLELTRVTRAPHFVARAPDVAFSGDALGITWAQAPSADAPGDVWFALARCAP